MIAQDLQHQIQEAMKARDELRVGALKLLSSALSYEKIAKMHDLSDDEELAVIRKEVKKRQDAIALYERGGAPEKAEHEKAEIEILKTFLPPEMSDGDLEKLVVSAISETNASEMKDMGRVIALVKEKAGAAADGTKIAMMVKAKLTS
jgi:uncharacterized protein YqeY